MASGKFNCTVLWMFGLMETVVRFITFTEMDPKSKHNLQLGGLVLTTFSPDRQQQLFYGPLFQEFNNTHIYIAP